MSEEPKTANAQHGIDTSRWREFLGGVGLESISLIGVTASRDTLRYEGPLTPLFKFDCNLGTWLPDADVFTAEYDGEFGGRDEPSGRQVCSIKLKFLLVYKMPGLSSFGQEFAGRFSTVNAAFHAWPFVRARLYALTSEMNLPFFMLPPLVIGPASNRADGFAQPSERLAAMSKPQVQQTREL